MPEPKCLFCGGDLVVDEIAVGTPFSRWRRCSDCDKWQHDDGYPECGDLCCGSWPDFRSGDFLMPPEIRDEVIEIIEGRTKMKDGPKLIVRLGRFRNVVLGYVEQMPEELRGQPAEIGTLVRVSGYILSSRVCPQLNGAELFLRGSNREKDDYAFAYSFDSEKEAIECVEAIRKMVAKVNHERTADEIPFRAVYWQDLMERVE